MSKAQRTTMGEYWTSTIEKEDALRSLWFRRNEARLNEIANAVPTRKVPEELKEQMKQDRIAAFRTAKTLSRKKSEPETLFEDPIIQDIMKPVDPAVRKLFYTRDHKDGRKQYLHERVKLLPEDRFYFPECSSWDYGWKMLEELRKIPKLGFGRQQIIKNSFYRRRGGVEVDPDWYREPAQLSHTFCNSNCL